MVNHNLVVPLGFPLIYNSDSKSIRARRMNVHISVIAAINCWVA